MNLDTPVHTLMTWRPRLLDLHGDLSDAWTYMLNGGFHHLPVVHEGRLVGILSATDLRAVLRDLPDDLYDTGVILDESRTIRTLMTEAPDTLAPDETVRDAAIAFASGRYHALPIVDGGEVVGMLTTTDLIRWMLEQAG